MKRSLILLLSTFISIQAFAEDNACEKIWDSFKHKNESIKIDKVTVLCKQIWEDTNKARLVKTVGLNPKDAQWMSTGECQIIEVNKNKYQVYYAYLKNDHSDISIINDNKGNFFSYFRNLGRYDIFEDKFFPTKKANKNGVELSCPGLGSFEELKPILSSYISNKKIDIKRFSFEDLNK
ncbi:TPA: hypothetical protein L2G09_002366 [Acinetobacter baumannii]|nr:hypothetical protein [Acinetobacter baumannii]HBN3953257.1 hypothetical protein [Acinetobacter baumannii]HBN4647359.1 hypothetical protein [Acinetobacter baumannii]